MIRFYGDGIGRSRTDPRLKDTHEIKPHGLCAITGEDSSGSYSSLLRCLFLSVDRNTYDKQLLAWFQKDPRQWTSHIAHFIAACEAHWSEIVSFIHSAFPEVRRQAEGLLSERRLIDTCACLVLTARIFMNYSASLIPQLSNDERTQRLTDMINLIVEVCRESEHRSQEIDPAKTFASIFLNAVRREEVKIGSVQEAENAKSEFLGVAHDQYWYLWPDGTYQAVVRAFQREGGHFPLTQRALWEALVNAGVLLPAVEHSKGPGRVAYGTRVSFLGRPRLLRIDPKRLHELENDS